MFVFVVRRMVVSVFTLIVATALVYALVAISGDPLDDLRQDQSPNRAQKIAARAAALHLDESIPQRYGRWAGGVAKCVVPGQGCDLGTTVRGQEVRPLLTQAAGTTIKLVITATVLAILLGVSVGIASALRQYSGFDYTITFAAFLFYSLPIFWIAVLLKLYLGIQFNNWLADPVIPLPVALVLGAVSGLIWSTLIGGDRRRRLITGAVAGVASVAALVYLSASEWFKYPALQPPLVIVLTFAAAVGITFLVAGLKRRGVLYAALATAGVVAVAEFALDPVLEDPSWLTVLAIGAVLLAVGIGAGQVFGGLDRGQAARAGALTGFVGLLWMLVDRSLAAVPDYSDTVNGRLISTIGSNTPNLEGDFWVRLLDAGSHLILPTLSIMLISFATYSRFTRATMLEVMHADYVRTARAKGLTERTVVLRHAFRNALIPVATLAAYDFGAVISGAVISENVFGWQGMGSLFVTSLREVDPNPVMAFFIVTAVSIVVFNMLADIAYAYLDPRVRLS
ncbi:MAG: ABC transporter permease [Kineosporiaceae bacterium]